MEKLTQEGAPETINVEKEQSLPTGENLQQQMADLKAKVEAARVQKEKDIEQKIGDRESLIGQAKSNDVLLAQANETLDYFVATQELGALDDPADVQRLEDLKTLVASLEQKRDEIDQSIKAISDRPEIMDKLQDAAKNEDNERAVNQILEQGRAELEPRMDNVIKDMESLTSQLVSHQENKNSADAAWMGIRRDIRDLFDHLDVNGVNPELVNSINRDWIDSDNDVAKFEEALGARRKSLGMFKGKEKAIIDSVIGKLPALRAKLELATQASSAAEEQLKADDVERTKVKEDFQSIMLASWEVRDKVTELTGKENGWNQLADDLARKVRDRMEELAGIARNVKQGDQWTRVGGYKQWFDAGRANPKNQAYYNWYDLALDVNTYKDPRKKESTG